MPQAETPYGKLFYAVSNPKEEKTIILIHGAASSHLVWARDLRHIEGYRVLAIDLPGHGRSEGVGFDRIEDYAKAVGSLLDVVNVRQCILLGHSMGGAIAQTLAHFQPERVIGLILIATAAKLPVNPTLLKTVLTDLRQVAEMINRWEWSPDAPPDLKQNSLERMMELPPELIYQDYLACDRFNITPHLPEITAPTLIIGGTADKMTPLAWLQNLATGLPHTTLETISGAGHYVILERPQKIGEIVQAWLEAFPKSLSSE
jgi:pimeloyl-ACP methyl ester carboxylesterase